MSTGNEKFIRDGRSIKEWIIDLASDQENTRSKAFKVLSAMMYGIPYVDTDLSGVEFNKEESRMFPDAIREAFSDPSFPANEVAAFIEGCIPELHASGKIAELMVYSQVLENAGPRIAGIVDKLIDRLSNDSQDEMLSEIATKALGSMGSLAKPAFEPLLDKMRNTLNPYLYAEHLAKIIRGDSSLTRRVISFLSDDDPKEIKIALQVLIHLDIGDGIIGLIEPLLQHDDEAMRSLVLYELANLGKDNETVQNILLERIEKEEGHNKCVAIDSLAKVCDDPEIVVPILVDALGDDDYCFCNYEGCVRSAAVYLMRFLDNSEAIDLIQPALPILLRDIEEMDGIDNTDDMIHRIRFVGKFGAKAKPALPKLKQFLNSWLEDEPGQEDEYTKVFKDAVDSIEADMEFS